MKAVVCTQDNLAVADRPAPTPGPGQLLIEVERCGICGSDLHARHQSDELADVLQEAGYDDFMRSGQEVVLGHEFTGRIAGHGAKTRKRLPEGTPVVAMPLLRRGSDVHVVGLSAPAPGAYAEALLLEESLALEVPNGLPPDIAALTEPMAVGWHAIRRGQLGRRTVAIVIGCGPVGLSIICLLKAQGTRTIIASDPSAGRRALARACGATLVVDPVQDSPYASAADHGHLVTVPAALGAAVGGVEKLSRLPPPWWHVWRALEKVGVTTPKARSSSNVWACPGSSTA